MQSFVVLLDCESVDGSASLDI